MYNLATRWRTLQNFVLFTSEINTVPLALTLLVIAGGGHHPLAITFGSHFNLDGANWL